MDLSSFLAKAWGLYLSIVSLAFLLNKSDSKLLFASYRHSSTVLFTGLVELGVGILTILVHNIWALDYRGLITFMGWVALCRGIIRVFAPDTARTLLKKYQKSNSLKYFLVAVLFIGLYLSVVGFGLM